MCNDPPGPARPVPASPSVIPVWMAEGSMGIELPDELAAVAAEAGFAWPQGDEDEMREKAKALRADRVGKASITDAEDAGRVADRLEREADGTEMAKVEIVRQLVDVAKNRAAVGQVKEAGQPFALLGIGVANRAAAANVRAVIEAIPTAAGSEAVSGVDVVATSNPGARAKPGHSGLIAAATGLSGRVADEVHDQRAGVVAESSVQGGAGRRSDDAVSSFRGECAGQAHGGEQADAGTGPIAIGEAVTPRHGVRVQRSDARSDGDAHSDGDARSAGGFDHNPTPPTGLSRTDDDTPPTGQSTGSGATASAAGYYSGTSAPGQPASYSGWQHVGGVPWQAGGRAPSHAAAQGGSREYGAAPAVMPWPVGASGYAGAQPPGTPHGWQGKPQQAQVGQHAGIQQAADQRQQPSAEPLGAVRQERESVVALFLVHMFPIGHLPVAADRPAMQLPLPSSDAWLSGGLRFPPHDHPDSGLINTDEALRKARSGERTTQSASLPAPDALSRGYEPLADMDEGDWNLTYLLDEHAEPVEYLWPPCESFPEGGCAEAKPTVLPIGTEVDRFGDPMGRIFAKAGTPFADRSIPPSQLESGYRTYKVLAELPVWKTESAGWFGQEGGGVRYRALYSGAELVALGYLHELTSEETRR